jgi:hypothetical protein
MLAATLGCGATAHGADGSDRGAAGADIRVPFAVSGERLEAWFLVAETSQIFDSFHDRQLDTDCSFVPTGQSERDRYACLPIASADVVYLDAMCREPALRFDSALAGPPPAWVTGVANASKRAGYHVADLLFAGGLDAIQATPPAVYASNASGCEPTDLRAGLLPASLYRLEPQDEETFVSASVATLRLSDQFSLQRLTAEDGAELTLGVLDRDDQLCEPQTDGVCVPSPFSVLRAEPGPGLFLDASCTRPAFDPAADGLLSVPKLGVDRTSGQTKVFELEAATAFAKGAQLDASGQAVSDADGHAVYTCQPDARFTAWAAGAERTAGLAVAGQLAATFGALRWVQQRAPGIDADSLTPLEPGGAFMDEQGYGCRARIAYDHQLDCSVEGAEVFEVGLFSDAGCTNRLYDVFGASNDAATIAGISRLRLVKPSSEAPSLLSFKTYSGSTYRSTPDQCEPDASTSLLLQIDDVMPLPSFTRDTR